MSGGDDPSGGGAGGGGGGGGGGGRGGEAPNSAAAGGDSTLGFLAVAKAAASLAQRRPRLQYEVRPFTKESLEKINIRTSNLIREGRIVYGWKQQAEFSRKTTDTELNCHLIHI